MAQRGRKSAASLAIVAPISEHRPPPPEGLTPEQAAEWTAIVRRLPHDFFPRESHRLLEAFCRHTTSFRILSECIDSFQKEWLNDPGGFGQYRELLALRDREGRALSSLATRLRITPASRYQPRTAATAAAKPGDRQAWEPVA
jgi:hypothetical protein